MSLFVLAMVAALQEVSTTTVVERIEFAPDETEAVSLMMSAGRAAGLCRDHLPGETRQRLDQEAGDYANETSSPGPALVDAVFFSGYHATAAQPGATASQCSDELADARLLIEGQAAVVERLIAQSAPLESRHPWRMIGQAAVDAGAPPRHRPALADAPPPASQAIQTPPQWATAPYVPIPREADAAGRGGFARIECIITVRGRARDCRLISESEHNLGFGRAALGAQGDYRFRPSSIDGRPVEARSTFTIRFSP